MKEEFQYNLGLVKKDTNLFQDTISFKDNYLKGNSELPILQLKIDGRLCNLLLDTGANINILNESVFNEINKNNQIKLINIREHINVGSGPMAQMGVAKLNFSYKRMKFTEDFEISDMSICFGNINKTTGIQLDGILGNKFFKDNQWSLDFEKMVIWVK